jgi:hypothetical protein
MVSMHQKSSRKKHISNKLEEEEEENGTHVQ